MWGLADVPRYRAKKIRAPSLEGAMLNVECTVVATQLLGVPPSAPAKQSGRGTASSCPRIYSDGGPKE